MKLNQTPQEIIDFVAEKYPEIEQLIFNAHIVCHKYKGSVQPYQAAVLYYLAKDYNHCNILEVGTGVGYSTYFLANACPNSLITTVNPVLPEMDIAEKTLWQYNNILYERNTSRWFFDYFTDYNFDFIFIDADHRDIKFDVQWFNRLNDKGAMVCHDYSDSNSKSPCLPVWNELTTLKHSYGEFDILVVDTENFYGMAGWYK